MSTKVPKGRRQVADGLPRSGAAHFSGDHSRGSAASRPRARARNHHPHSAGRNGHCGRTGGGRTHGDAERSGACGRPPGGRGPSGGTCACDGRRRGACGRRDDGRHAAQRDRPGRLNGAGPGGRQPFCRTAEYKTGMISAAHREPGHRPRDGPASTANFPRGKGRRQVRPSGRAADARRVPVRPRRPP